MIDSESNRAEFQTCIEAMFASLGGEFTDAALFGYWVALSDCELPQVQSACYRAIRESKFVPRPVELREFIFGNPEQRGLVAWADVLRHTGVGCYKHVDFQDPIINATIRTLGGWPDFLARLTPRDEKFTRIEFLKAYASLSAGNVDGEICRPLAGLSQAEVVGGQVVAPIPRRLGCRSAAIGIGVSTKPSGHQQLLATGGNDA